MILYQCRHCDKSFLNGVDLSYHIEESHEIIPFAAEKKCPGCSNENVAFLAKCFKNGREECSTYYCLACKRALKIESV